MTNWDDPPAPYPDDDAVKVRMVEMPVEAPNRAPRPLTATRRDGATVDIRRSLGLPADARSPDELVTDWEAWP